MRHEWPFTSDVKDGIRSDENWRHCFGGEARPHAAPRIIASARNPLRPPIAVARLTVDRLPEGVNAIFLGLHGAVRRLGHLPTAAPVRRRTRMRLEASG